jgi:hypothetical protein
MVRVMGVVAVITAITVPRIGGVCRHADQPKR